MTQNNLANLTLEEAKQVLRSNWEKGAHCPCCHQFVKLYKRKLNSTMAYALVLMSRHPRHSPLDYFHVPEWLAMFTSSAAIRGGDFSKLRYWGLIEEDQRERDDGSRRAGFYRMTDLGCGFVSQRERVPKYIYLYNQKVVTRANPDTETIDILEALGNKFHYADLMAATPEVRA